MVHWKPLKGSLNDEDLSFIIVGPADNGSTKKKVSKKKKKKSFSGKTNDGVHYLDVSFFEICSGNHRKIDFWSTFFFYYLYYRRLSAYHLNFSTVGAVLQLASNIYCIHLIYSMAKLVKFYRIQCSRALHFNNVNLYVLMSTHVLLYYLQHDKRCLMKHWITE